MSVIRVKKNENYTVMSNHHLQDKNLSLKAKGLLSFMLSLPNNWDYSIAGLSAVCKEGVDCIRSTVSELEEIGYITRIRERDEGGKFGSVVYIVREFPVDEQIETHEASMMDEPTSENPILDNPREINTKRTKYESNKIRNNNPPTPQSEDLGFGDELAAAFTDWLAYKQEKRQGYKPTGLKSLIAQVRKHAQQYGETAVATLIRECMAANWQGIIWDKLSKNNERRKMSGDARDTGGNPETTGKRWNLQCTEL